MKRWDKSKSIEVDFSVEVKTHPWRSDVDFSSSDLQVIQPYRCPQGHLMDGYNLRIDSRGGKHCRTCDSSKNRPNRQSKYKRWNDLRKERRSHLKSIKSSVN